MRIILPALLLYLASLTALQTAPAQPAIAPGPSPEENIAQDIKSFAGILNNPLSKERYDPSFFQATKYVSGAKIGYFGGQELLQDWYKTRGEIRIDVTNVEVLEIKGDDASARIIYGLNLPNMPRLKAEPVTETLSLHRGSTQGFEQRKIWQIVPKTETNSAVLRALLPQAIGSQPIFDILAQGLVHPREAIATLRATQSIDRLKQLCLGPLQFVQDYDQSFALAPEYAQEAFAPYLPRTPQLWEVPGHPNETYTFNGNLSENSSPRSLRLQRRFFFTKGKTSSRFSATMARPPSLLWMDT